ncbi:aldo/keto reductase [Sediminibacillus halophilus]|uniref:Predicted oxidoreductase n=1 Tax=Sediminibacillus halophilus TaxID=482461 RepID=A0A1G9RGP5_9BACI|nr:aldo/keto reductase [Sediminibacillus halophilus]SDM22230.1 Predicted oxidoreductase [Sediminibacillus halophilus]
MEKALQRRFITKMDASPTFFGVRFIPQAKQGVEPKAGEFARQKEYSILESMLDKGMNVIEATSVDSIERFRSLLPDRREELIVCLTCNLSSLSLREEDIVSFQAVKRSIDTLLGQFPADTIDILFFDYAAVPSHLTKKGEVLQAMKAVQDEGKVSFLGACLDNLPSEEFILTNTFDAIQLEYNLINQANENSIKLANEKGIGVFIRNGLANGQLDAGHSSPAKDVKFQELLDMVGGDQEQLHRLALHFLFQNKAVNTVLLNATGLAEFQQYMRALEEEVDEWLLQRVTAVYKS